MSRAAQPTDLAGLATPCPCGSGAAYDACCGPLHVGSRQASTPEELMRSRYAGYALGGLDYVWRTWHPRTRPSEVAPEAGVTWTGLRVIDAEADEVEFVACYDAAGRSGRLHERSVFARRAGRWFYLEARRPSSSS